MTKFKIPGTETEITIIDISGKPYMEVSQRLVWFNETKGLSCTLETEIVKEWTIEVDGKPLDLVRFKATIKELDGRVVRTAFKTKSVHNDKDYESCETGAIGRVLAHFGIGTQYATQDLEEKDLADSPTHRKVNYDKGSKTNVGNFQSSGSDRSTGVLSTKRPELIPGGTVGIGTSGNSSGESAGLLDQLSKTIAGKCIYEGKTFEEIWAIESATKFDWTKARIKEVKEGIRNDEWLKEYSKYARYLGVHA